MTPSVLSRSFGCPEPLSSEPVALVTGGSAGLGAELVARLADGGWWVVTDARHPDPLAAVVAAAGDRVTALAGDVTDARHRTEMVSAAVRFGRLDLLIHNASTLGPTPLPPLADSDDPDLAQVWRVNVAAPLALTRALLPLLRLASGAVVAISSDAAVAHYPGWGLYGASKAAADHVVLTVAEEEPDVRGYAIDPGDMRTAMHQAAFPGEDISDRPEPGAAADAVLRLLRDQPASGRYVASEYRSRSAPSDEPDPARQTVTSR